MNKDNKGEQSITHGEQINYVWITLNEVPCIIWEYMRKRHFQQKNDTFPQDSA